MANSKEIRPARLTLWGRMARAVATRSEMTAQNCNETDSGEEGSTLVEMAFVLPILLVVLTGIFSFGIVLNQDMVLTNAVNAGARAFALSRSGNVSLAPSADPCLYAVTTAVSAASTLKASNINFTILYTPSGTGNPNSGSSATTYTATGTSSSVCASLAMYTGDQVQVQASYSVTPSMFGWSKQLNLTGSSTELVN
jgi:Flp pilus assembly protein TadG